MAIEQIRKVQGKDIHITKVDEKDYISLTDMANGFEGGNALIDNWLRNKNTIEFLAVWESINNPLFNSIEFEGIKTEAGSNRFTLSVRKWVENTNAKGVFSKTGRYGGGTFAHKDIAFEFGSWLSPQFKLYLITEFQRLKELESNQYNLEWSVRRILAKTNYRLHTDAIKDFIIPSSNVEKDKEWIVYANEADILNAAIFGFTAKSWKESNPTLALKGYNSRDFASINELTVLSNLESLNSLLIKQGIDAKTRFTLLKTTAKDQLAALSNIDSLKSIKRLSTDTYLDAETLAKLEQENKPKDNPKK